jgi:hypothetical protein
MIYPDAIRRPQLEQSQIVPILMLCLLHARQLVDASPYVAAAEVVTDWCPLAIDLARWWSPAEQQEARAQAERAIAQFTKG